MSIYSILLYSSTAESTPPPESNFLCPLLFLSIPLPVCSSNWSYTLYLPLCASNSPSIIFHSGDVSSPFPLGIVYVLGYVCHFGSLPNDGLSDAVFGGGGGVVFVLFCFVVVVVVVVVVAFKLDTEHYPFHGSLACFNFLYKCFCKRPFLASICHCW